MLRMRDAMRKPIRPAQSGMRLRAAADSSLTLHACRICKQDYCVVQEMYTKEEIPQGGKQVYIAALCDGASWCHAMPCCPTSSSVHA